MSEARTAALEAHARFRGTVKGPDWYDEGCLDALLDDEKVREALVAEVRFVTAQFCCKDDVTSGSNIDNAEKVVDAVLAALAEGVSDGT